MPHVRKQIRDAVVSALSSSTNVSALVPAPKVEAGRMIPLAEGALPRVLVYLRGEVAENEPITVSPREYAVSGELVVEWVDRLKANATPAEDALDNVAEALEAALDSVETTRLGGLGRRMRYTATDVAIGLEGQRSTVSVVMRYALEYGRTVASSTPNTFATAVIEPAVGDSTADRVDDTITLPQ